MEIRAFRGWRYCTGPDGDVSAFIAPPYDVLTDQDKQELLDRSDRNIVAVDLPHAPAKEVGPPGEYDRAAGLLSRWQSDGVLHQDDDPAVYVYEQEFTWAGATHTRQALICGVRLTEPGGDVIFHEDTFAGPTADRLALTERTGMQLSPLLGFCDDREGALVDMLRLAMSRRCDLQGTLHGVEQRLWVVSDPDAVETVAAGLRSEPAFIADGHHRCTTALHYRDALREAGRIGDDHEANFVMFALVAADSPGMLILPTHRIVRGLRGDFAVDKLAAAAGEFSWQRCSVGEADLTDADRFLHRYGPGAMAFLGADPAEIWIGKLARPEAMTAVAGDQPEAWRGLDTAILHKLIIDRALQPWRTANLFIEYTPDGRVVLAACGSARAQLGICLQATPLAAVKAVARSGAAMPHKSTYFYPKLATGMVLKPLA